MRLTTRGNPGSAPSNWSGSRCPSRLASASLRLSAEFQIGHLAAGDAHQVIGGDREDVAWRSGRGPDDCVLKKIARVEGWDRGRKPDGRPPADRITGRLPN